MGLRRSFLWLMVASFAFAALAGIYAILFPGQRWTDEILVTTLLFGGHSIVCLACAAVLERRMHPVPMVLGIITSALALAGWLFLVWAGSFGPVEDLVVRVCATMNSVSIWCGSLGLLFLLVLRSRRARIVRVLTLVSGGTFALLGNLGWWELYDILFPVDDDVLIKLLGIAGILTAVGIVTTPILWKIDSLRRTEVVTPTMGSEIRVRVRCPRCDDEAEHATGGSRCKRCGLKFSIRVEEPVCACGYQLYGLRSENCPECGRAIDDEDRWASAMLKKESGHPPEETDAREES